MQIVERIYLSEPDTLSVELTITAPKVLEEPWTTTRLFVRRRGALYDIVEGQCVQGQLVEAVDEHGNAIFEHAPPVEDGSVPITIAAQVVEFRWVNPHSYLTVVDAAPQPGAEAKTWAEKLEKAGAREAGP